MIFTQCVIFMHCNKILMSLYKILTLLCEEQELKVQAYFFFKMVKEKTEKFWGVRQTAGAGFSCKSTNHESWKPLMAKHTYCILITGKGFWWSQNHEKRSVRNVTCGLSSGTSLNFPIINSSTDRLSQMPKIECHNIYLTHCVIHMLRLLSKLTLIEFDGT